MKKKIIRGYLIFLFLLGLAGIVNANTLPVIYDNGLGPDDIDNSYWSSSSTSGDINHMADDFQLQSPYWVTDVHWFGLYEFIDPVPTDNFIIRIYNNDNGLPTSPLGSHIYQDTVGVVNMVDTGLDLGTIFGDRDIYEYWTYINPFYAQTGQTYWLEIFNDISTSRWYWGSSGTGNAAATFFTSDWDSAFVELAFQLTGEPVPEPTTMLLLGTGLVGVAGAARRRKKKNQA